MNADILRTAMQFLARCQLTGQEVPAFNAVVQALQTELREREKPATEGDAESS